MAIESAEPYLADARGFGRLEGLPSAEVFLSTYGCMYVTATLGVFFFGRSLPSENAWVHLIILICTWTAPLLWLSIAMPALAGREWMHRSFPRPTRADIGWMALSLAVIAITATSVGKLQMTIFHFGPSREATMKALGVSGGGLTAWLSAAIGVFLSPLTEEVTFRGVLFGVLVTRYGVWIAAIVSSIVFAVYHQQAASFLVHFADGMVLALVFARTRSLLVSTTVHALFNAGAFLLYFAHHAKA